ncbi:unnamed protein product [Hydatigera taeniaeformis]|uniref:Uncharacterized protein n=1 Tax=Hydatigena taeniaeformis TaxID=6205 RepID=A0A3P7E4U3_HYDTA|nr:unnamed protein product [Hydatigera taeniaeformis]
MTSEVQPSEQTIPSTEFPPHFPTGEVRIQLPVEESDYEDG